MLASVTITLFLENQNSPDLPMDTMADTRSHVFQMWLFLRDVQKTRDVKWCSQIVQQLTVSPVYHSPSATVGYIPATCIST